MFDSPILLACILLTATSSLAVFLWDVRQNNPELGGVMRLVWGLTILYSSLLGLLAYFYAGRKQIEKDNLPRFFTSGSGSRCFSRSPRDSSWPIP